MSCSKVTFARRFSRQQNAASTALSPRVCTELSPRVPLTRIADLLAHAYCTGLSPRDLDLVAHSLTHAHFHELSPRVAYLLAWVLMSIKPAGRTTCTRALYRGEPTASTQLHANCRSIRARVLYQVEPAACTSSSTFTHAHFL